jgi:hypothetical protein
MQHAYNEMKLRALATFDGRGWISPPAWAVLAGYYPVRAAYTYGPTIKNGRDGQI